MSLSRSAKLAGIAAIALVVALGGVRPSWADATATCSEFAWPLYKERASFADPAIADVDSGAKLGDAAAEAFALKLTPESETKLALPATGKSKIDASVHYAGTVTLEGGTPGVRQVTISDGAWIDVIQDGKPLEAVAHTGKKDCPGLRKSVKFNVTAGPLVLQLTGVGQTKSKYRFAGSIDGVCRGTPRQVDHSHPLRHSRGFAAMAADQQGVAGGLMIARYRDVLSPAFLSSD